MAATCGIQIGDTVEVVRDGTNNDGVTGWHPTEDRRVESGDRFEVCGVVYTASGIRIFYRTIDTHTDWIYAHQVVKVSDVEATATCDASDKCCGDEVCSSDFVRIVGDELIRRFQSPAGKFGLDVMDAINRLGEMESVHGTREVKAEVTISLIDGGFDFREREHKVVISEVFAFFVDDEDSDEDD